MERRLKSGLVCIVPLGELRMAAVVAVNALGDIFDSSTEERSPDSGRRTVLRSVTAVRNCGKWGREKTCLPAIRRSEAVITNGKFNKAQMNNDRIHEQKCLCPLH